MLLYIATMMLLLIITPTFGHLIATNHKTGTGVGWKLSDYFDEPIDVHYHGYTNPRFINTVLFVLSPIMQIVSAYQ